MEGFGINTNVLETNIINLSVVIGVLIVVGKDVLSSLLDERKAKILQSLDDVETRYVKAQAELEKANAKLQAAVEKVEEIRKQSAEATSLTSVTAEKYVESEMNRLRATKDSTVNVEKQKTARELRELLIRTAIEKATLTLKTERSGATLQKRFIDSLVRGVFAPKQIKQFS